MQLNNLQSAWKQMKMIHSMHSIEATEILSIIESAEHAGSSKLHKVLYSLVMFIVLALFCQGG